jgi:hypothetical protein
MNTKYTDQPSSPVAGDAVHSYLLKTDAEPGLTYCDDADRLIGEIETFAEAYVENGATPEEALGDMQIGKLDNNHAVLEPASEHVEVRYDDKEPSQDSPRGGWFLCMIGAAEPDSDEYNATIGVTYFFNATVHGANEEAAREEAEALADAIAERVTKSISIHDDGWDDDGELSLRSIDNHEAGTDVVFVHSVSKRRPQDG